MSLGIAIKGPEGIVLSAESRTSLTDANGTIAYHFDSTHKVLSFSSPHNFIGAVTYGQATIGPRSIHSFAAEFESTLAGGRLTVDEFARQLANFYNDRWNAEYNPPAPAQPAQVPGGAQVAQVAAPQPNPTLFFTVAGFDEGSPYGRTFVVSVPSTAMPDEILPGEFGFHRGGQSEIVDRLLRGYDAALIPLAKTALNLDPAQVALLIQSLQPLQAQIPITAMGLQSYVDLAIFWIRSTIVSQSLSNSPRGCGGAIDVATITRVSGLAFVQRKTVCGELG